MNTRNKNQRRRGTSAVEFAICLPVVVAFLLASVELGRGMQVNHAIQEASQAACRVYAVKDTTKAQAEAIVTTAMSEAGIAEGDYNVVYSPNTKAEMDTHLGPVSVTITANFDDVSWFPGDFLAAATITGRCIMPADLEIIDDYDPINPLPVDDEDDDDDGGDGGGGDGGGGGDDDDDDDDPGPPPWWWPWWLPWPL